MKAPDRVAVVTGGGGGIGLAIGGALLADGLRVVLADADRDAVDAGARSLEAFGDRVASEPVDVRSRASIESLGRAVRERWGGIDVLVNAAGRVSGRSGAAIDDIEWDEVVDVNLRGVFLACELLHGDMESRRWGRIVNISSIAGQAGGTVTGDHYAASKAGVDALTKVFARRLAQSGVTVNGVAPALIAGDALDALDADVAELVARVPVGRLGSPREVAAAVAFLAGDDAGFITGATIDVNGGLGMR